VQPRCANSKVGVHCHPVTRYANNACRQDTAASVTNLVRLLHTAQKLPSELRLLDLCTGTGCIPLLFRHELSLVCTNVRLRALGVDVSNRALSLARNNTRRIDKRRPNPGEDEIKFVKADVLVDPYADHHDGPLPLKTVLNIEKHSPFWDILIANPPYISPADYWKTTTRSVRGYEPTLALVPPQQRPGQSNTQQGDAFYPRLLEIARDAEAKIVLLEVADLQQALRVAKCAQNFDIFDGIEIWRESPDSSTSTPAEEDGFPIVGEGNGRSVLCWRDAGTSWLGKPAAAAVESDAQLLDPWR
jgi:methylase of polypeptide subunit release factors